MFTMLARATDNSTATAPYDPANAVHGDEPSIDIRRASALGILADPARALDLLNVAITAPGSLAAADIAKAWVALPDRARAHTSWIMHESVREAIARWGDAFGTRTVDYGGQLQKLRDRPVYSTEKFPALASTTGSANQVVVGDFSGYLIAQRAGMTIEPVQTVVDANGLPLGKRGLFAWARIGADVIDPGLLRLLRQG